MNSLPGILQLIDTLSAGGAERVAVNLANCMPRDRYRSHLCATRYEGPLAELIASDVKLTCLERKRSFDMAGLARLVRFVRANDIRIIHAHATSLFIAAQASLFPPFPIVIWHDHHGRYATEERPALVYRLATVRVSDIISVNEFLAEWARNRLRFPAERVRFIPNFVTRDDTTAQAPDLPGVKGQRIVCVANLRPEKDHLTLVRAMALVVQHLPHTHLLLVGAISNQSQAALIKDEIARHNLAEHVSLLGSQRNVSSILRNCDVGVLSSASEGLPLALIEYGVAGLPAIATQVGQCPEVLDYGRAGIIVPPCDPTSLADALLLLLRSPEKRKALGEAFRQRVDESYTPLSAIGQICQVYEKNLAAPSHKRELNHLLRQ